MLVNASAGVIATYDIVHLGIVFNYQRNRDTRERAKRGKRFGYRVRILFLMAVYADVLCIFPESVANFFGAIMANALP